MLATFPDTEIARELEDIGYDDPWMVIGCVNAGLSDTDYWEGYKEAIDRLMRKYEL